MTLPVLNAASGEGFATLSEAMAASRPGDTLVLAPGLYREDFPDIIHDLTIRSDGTGFAQLTRATPLEVSGRAILNVPGDLGVNLHVEGLEIFGAKRPGPDTNGAAILHEHGNGNLTVIGCRIHGNENGLLVGWNTAASPAGGMNVVIRGSEIFNNGAPVGSAYAAGGKCHNIYVNGVTSLVVEDNHLHGVFSQGHQIKSRAAFTRIENNLIQDEPLLTATRFGSSYSIDISNGGEAIIRNNVIEKGPLSVNRFVLSFGGEGMPYPTNSIVVEGNSLLNARADGATLLRSSLNHATMVGVPVVIQDNAFAGVAWSFAGNIFLAGAGNDTLDGGAGADSLAGGPGDDSYLVNDARDIVTEAANAGTDTVRTTLGAFTLGAQLEHLVFVGEGAFAGTGNTAANSLSGGTGNDTLAGREGNDTLFGGAGDDLLDGGTGADRMEGGAGGDTYRVDSALDVVVEDEAAPGIDTVVTALNVMTLAAGVENLIYTGFATLPFTGRGNALANRIEGSAGHDSLDGGAGADTLVGGLGNDSYVFDDLGDVAVEQAGGGVDTVRTTLGALTLGEHVEHLVFFGTASFAGTGNALANSLAGGAGHDTLRGLDGADTLVGGAGNDLLDGGTGADLMTGGLGDDTYLVDHAGDRVSEGTGGGADTVRTTLASYAVGLQHVEAVVFEGAGNFFTTGNSLANTLTGAAGDDTLDGGGGADTLVGGAGNDTYVVDSALDLILGEATSGGTDTVRVWLPTYTLGAGLENLVMAASFGLRGTGNAAANHIVGGASHDWLDGAAGADTLVGGLGNDVYIVDDAGDLVVEATGGGVDGVQTSLASLRLFAEVEHLTFIGVGGFEGIGNGLANRITGGAGADMLDGGAGADTLVGGAGFDVFRFTAGEAQGDALLDFQGNGAAMGDSLLLVGFGTAAEGARVARVGTTSEWQVVAADGVVAGRFFLATALHASDVVFA